MNDFGGVFATALATGLIGIVLGFVCGWVTRDLSERGEGQ